MKKITTDQLWEVFKVQLDFFRDVDENGWDPSVRNLEELKAQYPVEGGIRRKAAMIGIRDNDAAVRPDPDLVARLSQRVFDEVGVTYSDIVRPPGEMVRKILKRGSIRTEEEFYFVRDLLSDNAPDEVEHFNELDRLTWEYEKK